MSKTETLSALIGRVYDTVLDPELWPDVLEAIAGFVPGGGAALYMRDSVRRTGSAYYDFGMDPHYTELYFHEYIKYDPLNTAYLVIGIGDAVSNSQLVDAAEFAESRFYREWVQPQGWVDNVIAALDKSATSIAACTVFRHERDGLGDDDARRRMRLLAPHLRRAVLIGNVIDLKAAAAATFTDALDGLGAGLFLVDAEGRIVHANAAGRDMLAAGDPLRSQGGRLTVEDAQADRTLRDIFAAADGGDVAVGARGVALPLVARNGERHVAHVLPLASGRRRRAAAAYAAVAALFVQKAEVQWISPLETLARHYKLTPGELRVLLAVVEIGSVSEIARALGIAETTVKTHLGRLYEKTGARRQADLVKLAAGFSNPLLD